MLRKDLDQLVWGYSPGLPEQFVAAWGCRAIYKGDSYIDVVHDRQDCIGAGNDRRALLAALRQVDWRQVVLAREPKLRPTVAEEFVAHDHDGLIIKVNTLASYGYLYVVAYLTGERGSSST